MIAAAIGIVAVGGGCAGTADSSRTVDAAFDGGEAPCAPAQAPLEPGAGPWALAAVPTDPVPMDDVTVFGFSQVDTTASDPQVVALAPDMVIRAWTHWDRGGRAASDYNFAYVDACHAAGVRFIGGQGTFTFADEWDTAAAFESIVTRDAAGAVVNHDNIVPGLHFGSWSNPAFRDDLLRIAKLQIDGGADGMFFDVVEGDFTGASFDGNEGFDDYHLADFNAYLLAKYPAGTDFAARFGMSPDNLLRADVAPGDLGCNFNYRTFLAGRGLAGAPFASSNPLATEWNNTRGNRVDSGPLTFEKLVTYRHFGEVVGALRDYARQTYGREIFVTANGIFPFVDFQSVGLYSYNNDSATGGETDYVPVAGGHLDGGRSLKDTFVHLRAESAAVAPGAAVVLFIDWPTDPMTRYLALSPTERQDYWRLYAAEAYANGLFFAFHLADTIGDPTATDLGILPFLQGLASFYRAHAALYHHVTPSVDVAVAAALPSAMLSVADQASPRRRIVHIVNHEYAAGVIVKDNVTVTVPLPSTPTGVTIASPDAAADTSGVQFAYAGGILTVTLPQLAAYSAIVISY